jgi:DNA-binding NtrC family response regulator
MSGRGRILVVDDDQLLRNLLRQRLTDEGYEVALAPDIRSARAILADDPPDVAVLDLQLPDGLGTDLLEELQERGPIPAIIVTAHGTIPIAVEALHNGAHDFLEKPFTMERISATVAAAARAGMLHHHVRALRRQTPQTSIVGNSPAMRRVLELADRVARSASTSVLLRGGTGTGKGMLARLLHERSPLSDGPFLTVTCSALAESLIESELFGHEKGAFTDASSRKRGLVELAHRGTLFLDEIGELPVHLQGKLLQFIEERTFRRLGGTVDLKVRTRILAATNRPLEQDVQEGRFREELYYRLQVFPIVIPPLRDRPEDIPLLAEHFLAGFASEFGHRVRRISPGAHAILAAHAWPGNVRELRNTIERGVLLAEGDTLDEDCLPLDLSPPPSELDLLGEDGVDLADLEKELLQRAIARAGGNRSEAGRLLGLSRHQVRLRLKKFGLE